MAQTERVSHIEWGSTFSFLVERLIGWSDFFFTSLDVQICEIGLQFHMPLVI
jgi:hypothetical protein